tara:strand:- start:4097 stop:4282 length:186 start_codon:yes stop_codon:yes gene_type:complete
MCRSMLVDPAPKPLLGASVARATASTLTLPRGLAQMQATPKHMASRRCESGAAERVRMGVL